VITFFISRQAAAQEHVRTLMEGTVIPLRECLSRIAPGDEVPPSVRVRVELPSGQAPVLASVDAAPGSPVDRCVRAAVAFVTVPEHDGPLARAECDLPLNEESIIECRPGPSEPLVGAPPANEPPRPRPNNIALNLLGVVIGGFSVGYSRAFRHVSIGAALLVQIPVVVDGIAIHGELEVLAWPSAQPHSGFFGGAALHIGQVLGSPDHIQVAPSVVLGWRFLFRNGINIGLGAAVGYGFIFSDCSGCESTGPLFTFEPLDEDGDGGGLYVRAIGDVGIAF
jgi:hypothetical protein